MAISYPLNMPSEPSLAPFTRLKVGTRNVVAVTESSFSLVQQVQEFQGKRWQVEFDLPPMKIDVAAQWIAFGVFLKGRLGTFLCGDLSRQNIRGSATVAQANGIQAAQSSTLAIKGLTPLASGVLKIGDVFQLGSGATSRLYMNRLDVDADGSGHATLDIWPNLRAATADGDSLTLVNPRGVFRLTEDVEWDVEVAAHYGLKFKAIEAL